jgi:DNA-binding transcriptional MocR family regulator
MTIWTPSIDETNVPRYLAIADAIERDVATGVLAEGARLPTHRELAQRLGVTVGTVTRGYAEAERRGLTGGEVGRGTFVGVRREAEDFGWRDAGRAATAGMIDMSLACPWVPPDGSDGRELVRTLSEIARGRSLDELLMYDPGTALPRQRVAAANWIGKLGLEISPEQIVVTAGAQHAMTVVLASFMSAGDVLATEELTYPGLKSIARMLGLRVRGIAMDDEGIIPEALDEACQAATITALYCVPTLHNPTGATMSADRRRAIAAVARKRGLLILEDQIHVSLQGEKRAPIATWAPERTFHITTLSKWVMFGLRVGFIAAPERAVERLRSGVRSTMWQAPLLMTEVVTRWISDGTAERIGQSKLKELEERHRMVCDVFGSRFHVRTHPHALHLWVQLPDPQRSDECVVQARQRGVLIAGAEAFAVGREVPHAVRVSIAQIPHREEVRRGLEIVAAVIDRDSDPYAEIL